MPCVKRWRQFFVDIHPICISTVKWFINSSIHQNVAEVLVFQLDFPSWTLQLTASPRICAERTDAKAAWGLNLILEPWFWSYRVLPDTVDSWWSNCKQAYLHINDKVIGHIFLVFQNTSNVSSRTTLWTFAGHLHLNCGSKECDLYYGAHYGSSLSNYKSALFGKGGLGSASMSGTRSKNHHPVGSTYHSTCYKHQIIFFVGFRVQVMLAGCHLTALSYPFFRIGHAWVGAWF